LSGVDGGAVLAREVLAAHPELLLPAIEQPLAIGGRDPPHEEQPASEVAIIHRRREEPAIEAGSASLRDVVWDPSCVGVGRIEGRLHEAVRLQASEFAIEVARTGRSARADPEGGHQLVAVVQLPVTQQPENDVPEHGPPPGAPIDSTDR